MGIESVTLKPNTSRLRRVERVLCGTLLRRYAGRSLIDVMRDAP